MIVETAVLCLALNVYHEARSELIPGQYAVALVTMNRAKQDPKRVCHETFKPYQFSWANGQVTKAGSRWHVAPHLKPKDQVAWDLAVRIASWTIAGRMPDFTKGSTHYHTKAVKPAWAIKPRPVKKVGAHVFYALN